MAYRGVKGSDPFVSKTSRNERFAQMSKQEQIIQQKKLEIQAKMQEMKAKQAIENVKKNTSTNTNIAPVTKPISTVKKEDEKPTSVSTINLFANDGSFLDQFKKISNKTPNKQQPESSPTTTSITNSTTITATTITTTTTTTTAADTPTTIIATAITSTSVSITSSSSSTLLSQSTNKTMNDDVKKDERNKDDHCDRNYDNNSTRERRWNGDKNRDWDCRRDRRRNESRWGSRNSDRRRSSSSSPSPPRHRSSPSPVDTRRYHTSLSNGPRSQFNQQQSCPPLSQTNNQSTLSSSSIPSLISQPMIQLTNIPPPNLRTLPPNVPRLNHTHHQNIHHGGVQTIKNDSYSTIDNHQNNIRMPLPPPRPHMLRPPPPPPPINTNIPPPTMTMPTSLTLHSPPPTQSQQQQQQQQQQHIIPSILPPQGNITQLNNLQPPNIPPPSLLPPMTQMPPNMLQINPTQTIVVTVANLPPPPSQTVMSSPMIMSAPLLKVHTVVTSTINSIPPPNLNIPPPNVPPPSIIQNSVPPPSPSSQQQQSQSSSTSSSSSSAVSASQQSQQQSSSHLLPTTYPIPNQVQMSVTRSNIQIQPPVRPPPSSLSTATDRPGHSCPVEAEQLARIVADCGDAIEQEVREKNAQDPKLWFLHQKQSAAYGQYRGLVAKFRAEKIEKSINNTAPKRSSGAEPYCPEEALSDNEDIDKIAPKSILQNDNTKDDSKEERKRKRRSRWSEPDNQVPITPINIQPGLSGINSQIRQSGVNIPGKLGQNAVILPPKTHNTKAKNPMLTKISRNDPALIQYARQTFGTLDLSEEQWKKAEDHYKINLLYQNLLKKREEVKRLESQGKHKYEYDSDEEIEGGTWEHKIRSAEMEATQMWAEELTAQAEGKHHIGDFLPPDELKKFMEQYNALKQGKEPDLSDYKEYKLKEDNIGFQMLQKLGWTEGQGLGSEGSGRVEPVNKATSRLDSSGLGTERPDGISRDDDEFDAYRKRMMLAYRFRPNPLNNPRRPYY